MANKTKTVKGNSPALGVKMAASAAIILATTKATANGEEEVLKAEVARLKSELDAERRTNRQLRREKESEVLKVRNEEQTKSSIALKDLSRRLLEEKQRELELQRESMRKQLDSDLGKIVKLKQRDIAKLRGDLARCQDQLKEELSNRGMSTSARATFDSERHKLLQEVRDLHSAKRQLEDRLTEAGETEKRLQLESRRLQESCKLEVSRVQREANVEVKKLLDELKTKDHLLEQMDRQIYPDRSIVLKSIMDKLSLEEILSRQTNKWISGSTAAAKSCPAAARSSSCSGRISSGSYDSVSSCDYSCSNCSSSTSSCSTSENKTDCICSNNSNGCSYENTGIRDNTDCSNSKLCEDTGKLSFKGTANDNSSDKESSSSCVCSSSKNSSLCGESISSCEDKQNNSSCKNRSSKRSSSAGSRSLSVSRLGKARNTRRCSSAIGQHSRANQIGNLSSCRPAADGRESSSSSSCEKSGSRKSKDAVISSHMPTATAATTTAAAAAIATTTTTAATAVATCSTTGGCALQTVNLQKKLYETEKKVKLMEGLHRAAVDRNNVLSTSSDQLENKIKSLNTQLRNMRNERESNRKEIKRLNDKIVSMKSNEVNDLDSEVNLRSDAEFYKQRCAELDQVLLSLRRDCLEKDRRIGLLIKSQQKRKHKYEPKTVRFLLPDEVDETTSDITEEGSSSLSSSSADPIEDDELLLQSMHKDYESLMEEHLKLEKYCASLVQSQSTSQDLHIKRESLDVAIQALEEKLRLTEERELTLKLRVQELSDQNEDKEFRILELEELSEKTMSASYTADEDDILTRNRHLEEELVKLRLRLTHYERINLQELENDASSPLPVLGSTTTPDPQRLSMENLRKLTASLSDSDEDNQMVQSFSTMTSGFDEISCISLELDDRTEMPDMPVEEEADLEKDADDVGPEMPTEECDDDFAHVEVTGGFSSVNVIEELEQVPGLQELKKVSGSQEQELVPGSQELEQVPGSEMCSELIQTKNGEGLIHPSETDSTSNHLLSSPDAQSALEKVSTDVLANASELDTFEDCSISSQNPEIRASFQTTKVDEVCSIASTCACSERRIRDLEDQVEILEQVDGKYSATIETLNEMERQLIAVLPTCAVEAQNITEDDQNISSDSINEERIFWTSKSDELESCLRAADREFKELGGVCQREEGKEIREDESETVLVIEHCIDALQETNSVLQRENKVCQDLEKRIQELEQQQQQQSSDYNSDFFGLHLQDSSQLLSVQPNPTETTDFSVVGALRRLALDVVAAGFKSDFLELKSLTHDFFSASVEDELNDIAFIDEDDVASAPSDASSTAELEGPSRLQQRNELRLQTKVASFNQRFDFLSPTSFDNPEWNNTGHLEAVNHCLFQQIEELERERDSLKDIVYRDDSVIHDMTQQISRLENSEQELKKTVCRLELAEEHAAELIDSLGSQCKELRVKLSRAESVENKLKAELESRGKCEAKMEEKLLRSVESLEQTTAKLRSNLQEMEKAKVEAERQSEELNCLVNTLQTKELTNLQRIKSLESLRDDLKHKTNDLEASLNSAYDEVAGLARQKDGLTQRLNSLVDENQDLRNENDELISEKRHLVEEVDRLGEEESFLREANRKMWLSLQASIEEKGVTGGNSCCRRNLLDSDELDVKSSNTEQTTKDKQLTSDGWSQTDKSLRRAQSTPANTTTAQRLTDILAQLILHNPRCVASFKKSDRSRGSLLTERKARLEEMLKFVSSRKIRLAANEMQVSAANISQNSKKSTDDSQVASDGDISDLDPVEGEEEFWSVVEKYEDILDIRVADTWNMWRHLEQDVMGLNLEQLKKLLEEREKLEEKSCQTTESSQHLELSVNTQTPYQQTLTAQKLEKDVETEMKLEEQELPPLPVTSPPAETHKPGIYSVVSCSETFTQTDLLDHTAREKGVKSEDLLALRHLLNQNERALTAQKHEVDRLTVEMRSWQQRALAASEQVERLATELFTAQQSGLSEHTGSITDSKTPSATRSDRRSRIELPSSQIPISVKRAVDFYSSISARPGSTSPVSPRTSSLIPRLVPGAATRLEGPTATTTQGPPSNGSSSSTQSQIPRLLPDWIQQQLMLQGQQQQQHGDSGMIDDTADDQPTSDSSVRLQQLPAAAATTSSYTTAECETVVPRLPFRDEKGERN